MAVCNTMSRIERVGGISYNTPFVRGRSSIGAIGCQSAVLRRKKIGLSSQMKTCNVYVEDLKTDDGIGQKQQTPKLRKPVSVETAIDKLKDENSSTIKTDDYWDPWDYNRMWSEISSIEVKNTKTSPPQKPPKRDGLQVFCVKRQPSDQTPLLSRRNLVTVKEKIDIDDDLSAIPSIKSIPVTPKSCMTLPVMGSTRDKSLLPKNALVRYLGKAVLSTSEIVSLDLSRPIQDLYKCQKPGFNNNLAHRVTKANFSSGIDLKTRLRIGENLVSYENGFVLLRINEKELALEDTSPIIINSRRDIRRETKKSSGSKESSKLRKASKMENQLAPSTHSKLFRRKSSPTIQRDGKRMEMSSSKISRSRSSLSEYKSTNEIKRSRKGSRCTDIFSCMNCTRRRSDGDVCSDEDSQSSSNNLPCHTNVVAKFELPRIAYCGVESIFGSFLLVWVYHVSLYDIHVIECHAAECDDRQHAKSLATSLGVNIQKAVRSDSRKTKDA